MSELSGEYLQEIRKIGGLKHAILGGITVKKREMSAEFFLITDLAYTEADKRNAEEVSRRFLPSAFTPKIKIVKRSPDEETVRGKIFDFMSVKFPAAAAFLKAEEIEVQMLESGANFCFDVASGEQKLFTSGKILDAVSAYLSSVYCGSFYGNVKIVEKESEQGLENLLNEKPFYAPEREETVKIRTFPLCNYEKIDGADEEPTVATYIADVVGPSEKTVVCGAISSIFEKQSKKGNTYYAVTISDGTGTLKASYFPKKATVEKVQTLKTGDWVALIGANEEFNGHLSFTAKKINYATPPDGFVPERKPSKPVPAVYKTVVPQPYVDYTQSGFFDDLGKPDDLKKNVFVVFDLETTGLNNQPAMGKVDKIIEIGAVKIVDGNIKEKFSSFVACNEKLPPNIVELTGICDADLVGAPDVKDVIADFYKFVDGAFLVGHNVQFDYRFIRYYGEEHGYFFENKEFDTLLLSQELLRGVGLANYKLNTVAGHYGFTFNHHRAFDDALVTAKVFTELIKQRGKLPL